MDSRALADIQRRLTRLERGLTLRFGVVEATSPLTVKLGGGDVAQSARSLVPVNAGDQVAVYQLGGDLLIAGVPDNENEVLGSVWMPQFFGSVSTLTATSNMLYFNRIEVPKGAGVLHGVEFRPTNTTGNVKPCLFDAAGTQLHVGSAAAVAGSGFGVQQQVPFSSDQKVHGRLYIGLAFSGAAQMMAFGYSKRGGTKSSAYTTPGNITVPTDLGSGSPFLLTY